MALESLLAKATLKPTQQADRSAPILVAEQSEAELFDYVAHFNVEAYEAALQPDCTFRTVLVRMSLAECKAIVAAKMNPATLEAEPVLEQAAARLQDALDMHFADGRGAFVRISTRSPKDTPHARARALAFIDETYPAGSGTMNDLVCALIRCSVEACHVHTGTQAMQLLLSSERIFLDCERALQQTAGPAGRELNLNFVLREYRDIPLHGEWRVFVCRHRVTCISQYFYQAFFDFMCADGAAMIDSIVLAIMSVFRQTVQPRLAAAGCPESYVCDFAQCADGSLLVLELNPFFAGTGALLFSWIDERALLEGLTRPDELVVRWAAEPLGEAASVRTELRTLSVHALRTFPAHDERVYDSSTLARRAVA